MLEVVSDQRIREKIFERAKKLINEPEKQGKALLGELAGLRSLRAVGQRYRVLYRVERNRVIVLIVAVGKRKAEKMSTLLRRSFSALGWSSNTAGERSSSALSGQSPADWQRPQTTS